MGVSFRPSQSSGSGASPCVVEFPFDSYTDSPDTHCDANKPNVRVAAVPQVGPGLVRRWRRALASLIPSSTSPGEDDDALPLLGEDPLPRRKPSRRSRLSRCLVRALVVFFVML